MQPYMMERLTWPTLTVYLLDAIKGTLNPMKHNSEDIQIQEVAVSVPDL